VRKAVVLGLGLLLCLVGVIVFAQLFGSGSILFPVTVPVKVFATSYSGYVSNVTVNVNPGNYTVVTTGSWSDQPVLSLRVNSSYSVTASWQSATLTRTIAVVNGSYCVIQVQVNTAQGLIDRIDFWPYW